MANEVSLEIDVKTAKALKKIGSFSDAFKSSLGITSLAITGLNQGFQLLGKGLDLVGAGFDSTIGAALEFEDSIAEITTLIDESEASTKDLGKTVLGLQKQFGGSSANKANAYYNAISSGAVTASKAQGFLTEANKLAVGGITDLSTAVDGLTTIISAFGLEADDTTDINDALFIAMKRGKTTIGELSSGIGVAAASAATLGVEYTELLAATSALTTGGISTNVAFTQIRATMTALSKPTTDLQKIYDKLNITSIKTQIEQDGLVGTLEKLVGETDGSTEAINKLFGSVEAVGAISSITSETIGSTFNAAMDDMGDAAINAGAVTEEAFTKISDTTSFKVKQLKGTVDAGFTAIGESIASRLGPSVDLAADKIGGLLESIEKGIDTFFTSMEKTSKQIDFGQSIDSGIKLIVKGLQKAIDLSGSLVSGILDVAETLNNLSDDAASPLTESMIEAAIATDKAELALRKADEKLDDFLGLAKIFDNGVFGSDENRKEIGKLEAGIKALEASLAGPKKLSVDFIETNSEIKSLREGLAGFRGAAKESFEAVQEELNKGLTVKVEKVEIEDDLVGPNLEVVGPQLPELEIDTDKLEKRDSKISEADEKLLGGFGKDLATGLSKGAAGANDLFKKGAVVAATAAFGPLGQAAGPIADLLLQGPEQAKIMIEEFVDQIPVIIDTLAETAPVIITTLAENIDKIIIPLSDPLLWGNVAIAVGKALITEAIPIMAQTLKVAFDKAVVDLGQGLNSAFTSATNAVSVYFNEKLNAVADGFTSFFNQLFEPFQGLITSMENLISQIEDATGIEVPEIDTGDNKLDTAVKVILAPITGGASFALASGGEIPSGFPNDTFSANLTSGENVVDVSTNKKLNEFLDGQGSGVTDALLSQILNALQAGQQISTSIEMDGTVLADAMLELNRQNARVAA